MYYGQPELLSKTDHGCSALSVQDKIRDLADGEVTPGLITPAGADMHEKVGNVFRIAKL